MHRDLRGKAFAAAISGAFYGALVDEGVAQTIGVVLADNTASRRSAAKVGVHEFAVVDVRKFGFARLGRAWRDRIDDASPLMVTRLRVRPLPDEHPERARTAESMTRWLETALRAGVPGPP